MHLRPQAARLLAVLLESPNTLVERDRLRAAVWGSRVVEWEMGLHRLVRDVRCAIEDDPNRPRYLQTVPRRGYRLCVPEDGALREDGKTMRGNGARRWPEVRWFIAGAVAVPSLVLVVCLFVGLGF